MGHDIPSYKSGGLAREVLEAPFAKFKLLRGRGVSEIPRADEFADKEFE